MKPLRIGIVGASTLKGKEIKDAVEDSPLATADVVLLDDNSEAGKLEAIADEATFIQSLTAHSLEGLELAFFATDPEATRKSLAAATAANCTVVDLSYGLEGETGFPVRSLWLEEEAPAQNRLDIKGAVIAHPVAIALALVLRRITRAVPITTAAATVLHPVSESGHAGMDELHRQTVNLLNFQSLPRDVFETQVAFNIVQDYGSGAANTTASVAQRISKHLATIAPDVVAPALTVVAAPVFHAHTMTLYVESSAAISVAALEEALHAPHLSVVAADAPPEEQPSNVNSAGEARVFLSVRPDMNRKNAVWIWIAADNLKIAAVNAVECARELLKLRPSGKVQ